ncbi:hypothetical protein SSABA_v1c08860 [Spiroplasma sabaudiense Ar-1343]|uniref:Lipoprotein n=1 Tax=Spiroplasma sabaudiense Ar-1343 TaxID=1276257 RepID=W6ABS4_9MOLU|nr:hypothetical protein [Spiroplasma sabaudiense]AHI54285.1 hypothetical protein SSABA_v1c08860 [Spiroplasma sabaudiense Ar-1343]
MKKLLSILAVTTMVVSAPLSAVACGRNKDRVVDDYDYDLILNELISSVREIVFSNINRDLANYYFIDEEDEPSLGLDFLTFKNLEKIIRDANLENEKEGINIKAGSEEFNSITDEITNWINWGKIQNEVQNFINSSINYRQVLYDGESPIQNFYSIEEINLKMLDEDLLRLSFAIDLPISFKDKNGNKGFEHFGSNYEINFIGMPDLADELNSIAEQVRKQLITEEIANKFEYISDSADDIKVQKGSEKNSNFSEVFDQITSEIKLENESLTIDNSKINLSSKILSASGTQTYNVTKVKWEDDEKKDPRVKDVKDYFIRDKISSDELSELMAKNNSSYIAIFEPEGFKDDGVSSDAVSVYGVLYNLGSTTFKNKVAETGTKFEIDPENENDKRVIGVIGMDVGGFYVNYQNPLNETISFKMPNNYVFCRQKTSFNNTKELFKDFVKVTMEFNKFFYNLDSNDEDFTWRLNLPPNLPLESLKFNKKYDIRTYFDELIFSEMDNFKANNPESKIEEYLNGYYLLGTSFEVDEQGYIRFYSGENNFDLNSLTFYWRNADSNFTTNGINMSAKSYFGYADCKGVDGKGPTKWQFILK